MILVTGGAGFIGSNIVASLNEAGLDLALPQLSGGQLPFLQDVIIEPERRPAQGARSLPMRLVRDHLDALIRSR